MSMSSTKTQAIRLNYDESAFISNSLHGACLNSEFERINRHFLGLLCLLPCLLSLGSLLLLSLLSQYSFFLLNLYLYKSLLFILNLLDLVIFGLLLGILNLEIVVKLLNGRVVLGRSGITESSRIGVPCEMCGLAGSRCG